MPKELRGHRYLTAANQWVADAISNDLPYFDYDETCAWYIKFQSECGIDQETTPDERALNLKAQALLGCNDRFYLVTGLLQRVDMLHPWLFARCREVEAEPDGCLDLWARAHGKTTLITIAGTIQDVICDREITIAIFAATKPLAQEILSAIKTEFETNEHPKPQGASAARLQRPLLSRYWPSPARGYAASMVVCPLPRGRGRARWLLGSVGARTR